MEKWRLSTTTGNLAFASHSYAEACDHYRTACSAITITPYDCASLSALIISYQNLAEGQLRQSLYRSALATFKELLGYLDIAYSRSGTHPDYRMYLLRACHRLLIEMTSTFDSYLLNSKEAQGLITQLGNTLSGTALADHEPGHRIH